MNSSTQSPAGFCKLSQFALILANGAEAVSFLQNQLTNDIKLLPENKACLAGYCTPKGRLLASMLVWKLTQDEPAVMLEVPAELQESFQKRLAMYILRAKVKLNPVTGSYTLLGIIGSQAATPLSEWFSTLPLAPYERVQNEKGVLIRLPDAFDQARYQWILTHELHSQIEASLHEKMTALPESNWLLSDIHAGIPHISQATQEKFVPQMINYDLVGGINFKKGCYPGQEIVARSHYLGKQKRRMALVDILSTNVQSGMEIFSSDDPNQPCGMVVNAQPNGKGGSDCLIEIKLNFVGGTVSISSGEVFRWLELPYSLPDE